MSHNSKFHLSGDFSSTPGDFSFDSTSYPTDPQYFSDFSNNHSNSSSTTGSNNVNNFSYQHSSPTPSYHSIQNFGGGNQLQPSSSFIPSDFSSSENFGGGIQCQFSFSSTSKYYSSGNLGGGTGGGLFTRLSSTGLGIYSPSCSYSSLNPPPPPLSPSISAAFDNCILSYLTTRFESHVSWAASLEPKVRDVFWDIYSRYSLSLFLT